MFDFMRYLAHRDIKEAVAGHFHYIDFSHWQNFFISHWQNFFVISIKYFHDCVDIGTSDIKALELNILPTSIRFSSQQ